MNRSDSLHVSAATVHLCGTPATGLWFSPRARIDRDDPRSEPAPLRDPV